MVEGTGPVCPDFARAAYDMHRVWKPMHAAAVNRTLRADEDAAEVLPASIGQLLMAREDQSQFETVQWWVLWLRLEDQMPNEPVIVHRVVVWLSVHVEEYISDMAWWGTSRPLSYARWLVLRKAALDELSVEFYGDVASASMDDVRLSASQVEMLLGGGGFQVPVQALSLRGRAKHSNFGSCDECDAAKRKWLTYRTSANRDRGDAEAVKHDIFQHIHEVKRERHRAQEFHQMCSQRVGWLFEYDDKCGSSYMHLPAPRGGRFTASEQGKRPNVCHACRSSRTDASPLLLRSMAVSVGDAGEHFRWTLHSDESGPTLLAHGRKFRQLSLVCWHLQVCTAGPPWRHTVSAHR